MRVLDLTRRVGVRAIAGVLVGAAATVTVAMLMSGGSAVGAPTCTMNFTATAGGSFLTAANWDVNRLPTTTDYACIPATITGAVTYAGTVTVAGVDAEGAGGFTASSGTLTLTDLTTASVFKQLTLSGATITGAADVTLKGATTFVKGTVSGTGSLTLNHGVTMTVTGHAGADANVARPFTNHGTVLIAASDRLGVSGGAVLTNAADGIVNLNGDNTSVTWFNSSGSIANSGLITRSVGTGTATIVVPVTTSLDDLTLASGTGTLSFTGGASFTGTAALPAGTTLSFDGGTYNFDTVTINGPGVTHLNSSTWALTNGTSTIASPFSVSSSTINGTGNLVIAAQTTFVTGTVSGTGSLTLNHGVTMTVTGHAGADANVTRPFTNHGTILIAASDRLGVSGGAVLTNAADGIVNLNGDNTSVTWFNSSGSIANSGLITRSVGTGTATIVVPVNNTTTGIIDLGTGTLNLTGGLTNAATVNVGFQTLNVTGGMTSASKGILEIGVGSASHGSVTVASTDKLGGELHINLQSGYTPTVGTAVQLITTTGTQSGAFKVGAYQIIGATNDGWKFKTSANKVVATVRPLSDVSPAITNVPALATQTIPFNFDIKVTNNGPNPANAAAVTLSFPASLHVVSGTLPAGCTQPTATKVHCSAGTLAVSATATFTITLVGSAAATDTLTVAAGTANTDIVATNNKASATVSVV